MSQHTAIIEWERRRQSFADGKYSRAHAWRFDGGAEVRASSSPHVVPLPWSDPAGVDPEEAFVASLSSCHMLWFLHFAARRGFVVERYRDEAVGAMETVEEKRLAITRVTLRPEVIFAGEKTPAAEDVDRLHRLAHENCFIANSVKTAVTVEGTWRAGSNESP